MRTRETLQHIKANGYQIDFGTVFTETFDNYKKIALQGGLAILLIVLMMGFGVGVLVIGIIGLSFSADSLQQLQVQNMTPVFLLGYMLMMMAIGVVFSPMNAGLIKMARAAYYGEEFSVGTVFDYYRGPYLKEIVLATLVITALSSGAIGLQWTGFPILGMVVSLLVSVFTFLTLPLIVFGNLKALEAIEGSILVVSKQFFMLIALLIVGCIFMLLGFFGFCVGILFTLPFLYSMYYIIYRNILGDTIPEEVSPTDSDS